MMKNYFIFKTNLGKNNITSINKDEWFKAYQFNQTDSSSLKANSKFNEFYNYIIEEEVLYNFGNYYYENDLRAFIKKYVSNNKKVYELPRLFFILNYSIPISVDEYQFIISQKYGKSSYSYSKLDFVLKNESSEDIVINYEFLPYKEKMFMMFPKGKINNKKILFLKKIPLYFLNSKYHFRNIIEKRNLITFLNLNKIIKKLFSLNFSLIFFL